MGNAILFYRESEILKNGWRCEKVIWNISISDEYPDGIRYRLVLFDEKSNIRLVLFDNHPVPRRG